MAPQTRRDSILGTIRTLIRHDVPGGEELDVTRIHEADRLTGDLGFSPDDVALLRSGLQFQYGLGGKFYARIPQTIGELIDDVEESMGG